MHIKRLRDGQTMGSRGRWISVSSKPAWSIEQVLGQPELHRETLFQRKQTKGRRKGKRESELYSKKVEGLEREVKLRERVRKVKA